MGQPNLLFAIAGALLNVAVVCLLSYCVIRANAYPKLGRWGLLMFAGSILCFILLFGTKWLWPDFGLARFWLEMPLRFMVLGMCLIMIGLMLTFVDQGIAFMQTFHERYNQKNLNRAPVKWLFQHPHRIRSIYRYGCLIGSIPAVYAIFFEMTF